jgi:hypothetical protein
LHVGHISAHGFQTRTKHRNGCPLSYSNVALSTELLHWFISTQLLHFCACSSHSCCPITVAAHSACCIAAVIVHVGNCLPPNWCIPAAFCSTQLSHFTVAFIPHISPKSGYTAPLLLHKAVSPPQRLKRLEAEIMALKRGVTLARSAALETPSQQVREITPPLNQGAPQPISGQPSGASASGALQEMYVPPHKKQEQEDLTPAEAYSKAEAEPKAAVLLEASSHGI